MNSRPSKRPDRIVGVFALVLYSGACFTVVVRKGLSGGPFEFGDIYGLHCISTGWMVDFVGWLANPAVAMGVVLLILARPTGAAIFGVMAMICAVIWSVDWYQLGVWQMLRVGYFLWMGSILVVSFGSVLLLLMRAGKQEEVR